MPLRPGQPIGDVAAYSGLASPVDVASRPQLRASLLRIVSDDLAAEFV